MTLETLFGVIFDGIIFKEDVILSREDYTKVQELGVKQKVAGGFIADYIKARRTVDKKYGMIFSSHTLMIQLPSKRLPTTSLKIGIILPIVKCCHGVPIR